MKPRYRKVIRDLSTSYSRTLMLILAIALGVFGIGSILGGQTVLNREMETNYLSTVPASATIEYEGRLSDGLLDTVRALPGIKNAERRSTISARMKVNDQWYPVLLFVIDDFARMEISKVLPVSGARSPSPGSMLVERTALQVMQADEGDQIVLQTPNGQAQSLKITGVVHDPGLAPAWQEQAGYAYVTMEGLRRLGEEQDFDLLRLQVSENPYSASEITTTAEQVADLLKTKGIAVHEIQVPPPGEHPHQSQMNAVLTIFTIFCFMILVLGSILVATSMATLMVKQIRQIGVMKTIGATSMQIGSLYFLMLVAICIIALVISVPLSRLVSYAFSSQIAGLLNLEITDPSIPLTVPAIQIVAGIGIPLITAAFPLLRGSRISVRAALDNFGVTPGSNPNKLISRISNRFNDIVRLAWRNAFRQRSRLALTLGLLAAGGAMFMTALNVSDAWDINLRRIYTQRLYDLDIRLNDHVAPDPILEMIKGLEGVRAVEGWDNTTTAIPGEGGYEVTKTYPDKGHGSFSILALPVNSTLINPTLTDGQWLHTEGSSDVVLNQLARDAGMKVGHEIRLSIQGKPTVWKIIGFTEDVGAPATAYVSIKTFADLNNTPGKAGTLRIAFTDRSRDFVFSRSREIAQLFEKQRISVSSTTPVWLLHNAVAAHMKVLVNSLLAMAVLMAIVGTLGLTSTISMSVLERTREIGVMRAIGATPVKIRGLIVWEGIIIGILSVVVAFLFSLALSYFLGRFIGYISFRTTLTLTISGTAILIWLAIIIFGSYAASAFPARKANRITTREALAFE